MTKRDTKGALKMSLQRWNRVCGVLKMEKRGGRGDRGEGTGVNGLPLT